MQGTFEAHHDFFTGKDYFTCIIKDATACCSRGIEFVPTEDYSYPGDYPNEGDMITVTGVFGTYEEGFKTYCTLWDASFG